MPLALVLLVINVALIVHAAKTGRFWPWGYIILLLPGIGALVYVLAEIVPSWFGSPEGQRTRQRVANRLDPQKRYRQLTDELATTDTIANRAALAEECLALGKFSEARWHYDKILEQPLGDEPVSALGRARAEFALDQPDACVAMLDELRRRWPDYESADGHLLYARALEAAGRTDEALAEYQAVSGYYPGAEARVRHGLLLAAVGRKAEARALFSETLAQLRRAPKYVRKVQAEWIAIAEKALRG
jgi:hypothetical protein